MKDIQEVFNAAQEKKKELKTLRAAYKDALENTASYKKILEDSKTLRAQKKQIEDGVKTEMGGDFIRIEELKKDIAEDQVMINDIALSRMMKGEEVRIVDGNNVAYEPIFTVRFKKAGEGDAPIDKGADL